MAWKGLMDKMKKRGKLHPISYRGEEYSSPNPVAEELVCAICRELVDEPQQTTPCGHMFCKECLVALVREDESRKLEPVILTQPVKCPTCRTSCDGWFEDKNADRRVKNVEIFCPNRSCEWKGSLCHLVDHELGRGCERCQYEPVFCTLGCGEKVVKEDLQHHIQNTCLSRLVNCEYCQWLETYKNMSIHYSECQKYPIPCPNNCDQEDIPVQEVEGHLQDCPEQVIKCSYSDLGCKELFKRRALEDHCERSKDAHMRLLQSRLSLLTQAFVEIWGGGPSNFASASSHIDPLSLVSRPWLENTKLFPSMPWIIRFDQFSKKKTQTCVKWTSDPFFTTLTGYKLCLLVVAGGNGEQGRGHVSVFTKLQQGPNDDILSWPFDKTVEVTLLNQLEDRCHYSDLIPFKDAGCEFTQINPAAKCGAGWGLPRFIPHDDLDKRPSQNFQYLKDDCLFFKIELK